MARRPTGLSPELRFLLAGLHTGDKPGLAPAGLDWDRFLHLVQIHAVTPQIVVWLRTVEGVPPDVLAALADRERSGAARSLMLTQELLRLGKRLDAAGIEYVTLKGPVLAQALYGSPAARTFGDLDVLVRPAHVAAAMQILEEAGFVSQRTAPAGYEEKLRAVVHEGRHLHPSGAMVEIHWQLLPPRWGEGHVTESVWASRQRVDLAGRPVWVPAWEEHVRYLVLHGHKHAWMRLQWLLDVAVALEQHPDLLDWLHANDAGMRRRLASTLLACDRWLGTRFSPGADRASKRIVDLAERHLARECDGHLPGGADILHWARSFDGRRKRWGTPFFLLRPGLADWEGVPVSPAWSFVHFVTRPFRLVSKHLRSLVHSKRHL